MVSLAMPEFKLAYLRYRAHALTQASVLLTSRMYDAVATILDVLDNPAHPNMEGANA